MPGRFSPTFRLVTSLILSAGLHGGLVYSAWVATPVAGLTSPAPVKVSFLKVDTPSPVAAEEQPSRPASAVEKAQPPVEEPPAKAPGRIVTPQRVRSPEPLPEPAGLKTQAISPSSPEEVCTVAVDEGKAQDLSRAASSAQEAAPRAVAAEALPDVAQPSPGEAAQQHAGQETIVDATPRYSSNPLPEYPHLARQRHWEGVVWLLVEVSADGHVNALEVEQSSGYKVLDRSASRTVRRWRFAPATRAGVPVASKARVPVRFRLEGG